MDRFQNANIRLSVSAIWTCPMAVRICFLPGVRVCSVKRRLSLGGKCIYLIVYVKDTDYFTVCFAQTFLFSASECQQASNPPCEVFRGHDLKNNLCEKYVCGLCSPRWSYVVSSVYCMKHPSLFFVFKTMPLYLLMRPYMKTYTQNEESWPWNKSINIDRFVVAAY